ncbi:hypothetical protein M9H77_08983 [Catharanthus roseus]|uniref:Uncharacterized protein n=1 Tax=Catharanthus roseus TaxID=4058 RepID=A0ACC0BZN4_CATRO|nr:hypothetical protein M9H77_08983 [Catharanthus roseus]
MRNCSSVSFPSLPVFQALNRITESRANPAMVNSPEIVWDIVLSEYHNDCSWGGKGNRELIWKVTATQDLEPFHECATMIDHQQNPTCSGPESKNTKSADSKIILWRPPAGGFVKINTHGAAKGNTRRAEAGGLIRDSQGEWIGGFHRHIGITTNTLTELWAVPTINLPVSFY